MKNYVIIATKLGLSAALIWYAFSKIDAASALREMRNLPATAILAVLSLLIVQYGLAGWRLMVLLLRTGGRISYATALDAVVVGAFFSQTLISFVGGDAMRIWRISRQQVSVGTATRAVLLDRILGFIGLIVLIVAGLPFLFDVVRDQRVHAAILLLVAGAVIGCLVLIWASKLPRGLMARNGFRFVAELSIVSRGILATPPALLRLLAISIAVQILNVGVIYVAARGLDVQISLLSCLVLIPPVLFLSMMPISFAGWGVRESAMVAALSMVGVSPAISVALSITYGLALIVVSLPGGLLWFHSRRRFTEKNARARSIQQENMDEPSR